MLLLLQFWKSEYNQWFWLHKEVEYDFTPRNMWQNNLCLVKIFRSETKQGQYMFDIPTVANSIGVTATVLSNHLQILKVQVLQKKILFLRKLNYLSWKRKNEGWIVLWFLFSFVYFPFFIGKICSNLILPLIFIIGLLISCRVLLSSIGEKFYCVVIPCPLHNDTIMFIQLSFFRFCVILVERRSNIRTEGPSLLFYNRRSPCRSLFSISTSHKMVIRGWKLQGNW